MPSSINRIIRQMDVSTGQQWQMFVRSSNTPGLTASPVHWDACLLILGRLLCAGEGDYLCR